MNENLEKLHNQIIYLAREHRKTEAKLIDQLQRADELRLYLHRGHASLFRYVCDQLGFSEAMTSNLITVESDKDVKKAITLMIKHNVSGLPVVKNSKLVGIVTKSDIVNSLTV